MKNILSKFNTNWIAIALLLGTFIVSVVRFYHISGGGSGSVEDSNVIRVVHWQLEPGFRESLQWAIDEYNELPHVKAEGIRVEQSPISQAVYNQFMNVHLISGTAPDIAVSGNKLSEGSALAKFYTPLGSYTDQPNPYNALEYQKPGISPELSKYLATTSWRDTFFDGLQGGYNNILGDYYGIPISTFGGARMFYNLTILEQVKDFAKQQSQLTPQPEWMQKVWRSSENSDGYLPKQAGLAWLQSDRIPDSLGELFFYCNAIKAYALEQGNTYLVPISVSKSNSNDISLAYRNSFLCYDWEKFSMETGSNLTGIETLAAYEQGIWNFESPQIIEFFKLSSEFADFYPTGFLGLDREQTQRRFVLGQAAMIYTGAWDAPGIFTGVKNRDRAEDAFEIELSQPPLPRKNERWAEYIQLRLSEADSRGGVPFAINQSTPHFDRALDFLRFLTSHRINEAFNKKSGWLPVISDAEASTAMAEFSPVAEGLPKNIGLNLFSNMPSAIINTWTTSKKLFVTREIGYKEFMDIFNQVVYNDKIGIRRAWIYALQKEIDQSRGYNRTTSVEHLNTLLGEEGAEQREVAISYLNLIRDEGVRIRRWWSEINPDTPFPEL
ncbi:ABC transporter substrate-binding protein [Coraliomargarita algicola]|uniref:ABC transporter substrate-binding protein n=1 Tax=Coraliomargarita algicola TaxID=3092156 RepID=A0ABZ0RSX9_9BACT|nr:ABC transporter substrate-binding protein [Coraliomargarita sp. J2-16]WPJ96079.1 ABC transporter substrate-binding protein [Coraliomargarita sp. J2-16]